MSVKPPASPDNAVIAFIREHMALAEPAVFAMGFAEGIPGLSLLVPSSALFLAVGTAHGAAGGLFWQTWLAASAGAVLGDCVTYWLGRRYKDRVESLAVIRRYAGWRERGIALFERWGVLAIIGGKFLGFMRPFLPVVAGMIEMPLLYFLPASVISSLAWAGAFLAPGYGVSLLLR